MNLKNRSNGYVESLEPGTFDKIPKTVFAAIAVSFAIMRGDDEGNEVGPEAATPFILREWWALYHAGIVDQRPPGIDPTR